MFGSGMVEGIDALAVKPQRALVNQQSKKCLQMRMSRNIKAGMYVCICNHIRDKEIDSLASEGAGSPEDVFSRMGCRPVCGRCLPEISETLSDRRRCCIKN
jgi:bacterioferritin-associated ferredoxin